MFVSNDSFKVELFYRTGKNSSIKILTSLDGISDDDKPKYKKATFEFRPLDWKKFNELGRAANKGGELDWGAYKEKKLVTALVGWDAKDDKGVAIPLTPDNVLKLHPMIAETLLSEFDRLTLLGEEEKKN